MLDQWLLIVRSLETMGAEVEKDHHLIEGLLEKLPASVQTQVGLQCERGHQWTVTSLHDTVEHILKIRRSTDQRLFRNKPAARNTQSLATNTSPDQESQATVTKARIQSGNHSGMASQEENKFRVALYVAEITTPINVRNMSLFPTG